MDMNVQGAHDDIRTMLQDAITAVQAASSAGRAATQKIEAQANHPELKEMMRQGSQHSEQWAQRLGRAAEQAGAGQGAEPSNPIIDAIQQVGGKIITKATDPVARDLGIIASGQLALHYYIAAFGTMAAYAKLLGMQEVAQTIHQCLDEARCGDERYTELAGKIAA